MSHDLAAPGLLPSMWRFRWVSLAIIVLFGAVSAGAGFVLAPRPAATAAIALKNPGSNSVLASGVVGDASLARYTKQRADFITSDDVLTAVATAFPGKSLTDLRNDIAVTTSPSSNLITISATSDTATSAVKLANTVATSYGQATQAQVKQLTSAALASIAASRKDLTTPADGSKSGTLSASVSATVGELDRQASALQTDSAVFNDGIDFVRQATLQDTVVPGLSLRYTAAGLVFGAVVAAVVAWLRADRRRRVTDEDDPETLLEAPLLATVGTGRKPAAGADRGAAPRQYRLIGASLGDRSRNGVLAVMAPDGGRERVEVSQYLAVAMASEGARILVIDADPVAGLTRRLGADVPTLLAGDGENSPAQAEKSARAADPSGEAEVEPQKAAVGQRAGAATSAKGDGDKGHASASAVAVVPDPLLETRPLDFLSRSVATSTEPAPGPESVAGSKTVAKPGAAAGPSGTSAAEFFGPIRRVMLRDDVAISVLTPTDWSARDNGVSRHAFVEGLTAAVEDYDMVLLDLPSPEDSPLVPALLRISTQMLVVVPKGAEARSVERLRRTATIFSTPVVGYVFALGRG